MMMTKQKPISASLQKIAACGFKEGKSSVSGCEDRFDLLLFLAWQAWNQSIKGLSGRVPNFKQGIQEVKTQHGISKSAMEDNFISSDPETLVEMMLLFKEKHYPDDRRLIVAMEKTPEGILRIYSDGC